MTEVEGRGAGGFSRRMWTSDRSGEGGWFYRINAPTHPRKCYNLPLSRWQEGQKWRARQHRTAGWIGSGGCPGKDAPLTHDDVPSTLVGERAKG
jgi:hypothetical protein